MTNVQDNIVEHVLECISLVATYTNKFRKIPDNRSENKLDKSDNKSEHENIDRSSVLDMLEEISILLCKLLATMITAPITGRMFTPLPSSKYSTEDLQASLQAQMSQKI